MLFSVVTDWQEQLPLFLENVCKMLTRASCGLVLTGIVAVVTFFGFAIKYLWLFYADFLQKESSQLV